jgi:hypothetical protein
MPGRDIFNMPFATVYPLNVRTAECKKRSQEEGDHFICWLTGYEQTGALRAYSNKDC